MIVGNRLRSLCATCFFGFSILVVPGVPIAQEVGEDARLSNLYFCNFDTPASDPGTWTPTTENLPFDVWLSPTTSSADGGIVICGGTPDILFLDRGRVVTSLPFDTSGGSVWNYVVSRDGSAVAYRVGDSVDIQLRNRVGETHEFSPPRTIPFASYANALYGVLCLSNQGETLVLRDMAAGGRLFVMDVSFQPPRLVELYRVYAGSRLAHEAVLSADGKCVFFMVDNQAVFSHYENGLWTPPEDLLIDGRITDVRITDCNTDASWLLSGNKVIERTGETFTTRCEITPPEDLPFYYQQISEDGQTVAFILSDPETQEWKYTGEPPPRDRLYVAQLDKADGEYQARTTLLDEGNDISFRLLADGRSILWWSSGIYMPDPSAVSEWTLH
ncbi:MAG: hypothetical protein ABIH23_31835 [bacterium]